jgi:hypothetical protein
VVQIRGSVINLYGSGTPVIPRLLITKLVRIHPIQKIIYHGQGKKRMEKPRRIKGKTVSGKGKVKTVVTEN